MSGDLIERLTAAYVYGKEWSVYPFVPPLFTLLLSLVIAPRYDRVLNAKLFVFLKGEQLEAHYELMKAVIGARTLQIAYLTEVPVFAISVISAVQSNYPVLLGCVAVVGLLTALYVFPKVFLSPPDYLATTEFPETPKSSKLTLLARAGWHQHDFYVLLLLLLNLFFILVIIVTLPEKRVN